MATDFRSWAAAQRTPFTLGLVASLVGFALLGWLTQGGTVLALALADPAARPWGLLTYPWAYSPLGSPFGLIFLLFLVMWLVQFGGAVEREMGTLRFAAFWFASTLLFGGVAAVLGMPLMGPMLPGAALVVLWGARNRSASIMLYGLLPLSGTWLAALVAASVLFTYGAGNPLHGLLVALPLGLAWAFGLGRLPLAYAGGARRRKPEPVVKGGTKYDAAYYEGVKKREIEREEQERLRRLFEGK